MTGNDNEKIKKLDSYLKELKNKKSKFIFCVPTIETPSALVYEIYFHAWVVSDMGYDVYMLVDKEDFTPPEYVETELTKRTHLSMGNNKLNVGPHDFMIIPESYTNVMEQTKEMPCKRIGFLQSIDYKLNALIPGMTWRDFNIEDVITTSEIMGDFLELFFGKNFYKIKYYDIGIPDYFKKPEKPKKPIISIIGRNPNEITKIVKLFYIKYPQYRWITFDAMLSNSKPPVPLTRKDFAERLKENFAAVWVDRISSFGTFPLECMKVDTIPISLKPDITPNYILKKNEDSFSIIENSGIWTKDFYDLPLLIGDVVTKFLDDSIPDDFYKTMNNISKKHNPENSKKQLIKIYQDYIDERITLFNKIIKKDENENKK